jgi:hypothetical protein
MALKELMPTAGATVVTVKAKVGSTTRMRKQPSLAVAKWSHLSRPILAKPYLAQGQPKIHAGQRPRMPRAREQR